MSTQERAFSATGVGRTVSLGISQVGYELRRYSRSTGQVFFTFFFPSLMFLLLATAFSGMGEVGVQPDGTGGISQAAYFLPGMLASGILLSGVQGLGIDIAVERSAGTLKQLGGTPLSPTSYMIGKVGLVLVSGIVQAALLLGIAFFVYRVELPTEPSQWLTFAWIFVLGILTSTILGVAISALPRGSQDASAIIVPIVLVQQFISGVYIPFYVLPEWLQNVASVFPLKWIAQGMRSVFFPEHFASMEQNGEWGLGWIALALLLWAVIGFVFTRLTFRWVRAR
ncbi:ABC transporter permease [Lysinibacter sp. HNR]|uniref:ABC transporter permease n=1 Tax=Lysinibacter sp. HNR TaxID=3031408 RepID=UPI002434DCD6|nr:ABC transporter permease [Lysinibacter sp. HNR]WGD37969.1 ABC transporter permease [Lysinibacter sp. HNR]